MRSQLAYTAAFLSVVGTSAYAGNSDLNDLVKSLQDSDPSAQGSPPSKAKEEPKRVKHPKHKESLSQEEHKVVSPTVSKSLPPAENRVPAAVPQWAGKEGKSESITAPAASPTSSATVSAASTPSASATTSVPTPPTAAPDSKNDYTFFHPTPRDQMRDFNPDRPASINTAFTIDAGHLELEIEAFNYRYLKSDILGGTTTTTQLNYPNPNLRVGITNNTELQIAGVFQQTQTVETTGFKKVSVSGVGDLNLRLKRNILGNEGGPVSWALMPGIKIPTSSNGVGNSKWEPTLMIPLSLSLPGDWGLSLMPEIDLRKNASGEGMHAEFNSPFTVGHHLFWILDGYSEFVTHSSNDVGAVWSNFLGLGVAAKISNNVQIDFGCNLGLNSVTAQYNPFAGVVFRY